MLRPTCLLPVARLSPPRGLSTPRSDATISPDAWGLLPGAPTLAGTGFSPAGDALRADVRSSAPARLRVRLRHDTMLRAVATSVGPRGRPGVARAMLHAESRFEPREI